MYILYQSPNLHLLVYAILSFSFKFHQGTLQKTRNEYCISEGQLSRLANATKLDD